MSEENNNVESALENDSFVEEKKVKKTTKKVSAKEAYERSKDKNRVLEYLKEEHSWEGPLLAILSILVIALGIQLATDQRVVVWDWLESYQFYITVFILFIGISGFALAAFPIYAPSLKEWKKCKKPAFGKYLDDLSGTLLFVFSLSVFFWVIEIGLTHFFAIFN